MIEAHAVPFTASKLIQAGPATYKGCSVHNTHATLAITFTIYDGISAAGTILDSGYLAASQSIHIDRPAGVHADTGIYIAITGAGGYPNGSVLI